MAHIRDGTNISRTTRYPHVVLGAIKLFKYEPETLVADLDNMPSAEPYTYPALADSAQDISTWPARPIVAAGKLRRHVYSKLMAPH